MIVRGRILLVDEETSIQRGRPLADHSSAFLPFTAQTRMSGVNLNGREIRKGACRAGRWSTGA